MTGESESEPRSKRFLARCISVDLEVGRKDKVIHQFAAVRGDSDVTFRFAGGSLSEALAGLDDFAQGAEFLVGHNLIEFDRQYLAVASPSLRILQLPTIDTLRLNPLAFPRNPYHRLVKHYQDGGLKVGRLNDPEHDARLTLKLLGEQIEELGRIGTCSPDLLTSYHWLTATGLYGRGFGAAFSAIRDSGVPPAAEARTALAERLRGIACENHSRDVLGAAEAQAWPLSYALAWMSVLRSGSVLPPWVRHQFPDTYRILKTLRDDVCEPPRCCWCSENHSARRELKRWFGFDDFRTEPKDETGRSLQASLVEGALLGEPLLGILPTGGGKSICYQIPALSRYEKTGALTVVVSPLVALMSDQVSGMKEKGIMSAAAITGHLSMPERTDVLDRVRLGDIGLLLVSPEQLRNRSVRKVLRQREIGGWVLDEAHCLSKWGHDFRPDYRYVGRFIREWAGEQPIPPILALTATARQEVKQELIDYFRVQLGKTLRVVDGGTERTNLAFDVVLASGADKLPLVFEAIEERLPRGRQGGAIVYCATRNHTEEVAAYLRDKGLDAEHYHARLAPEKKKSVQTDFIAGALRIIVATNAFGMGIDKPDVRLVVHADIPGSLENYIQEAGRAGRDRNRAECVLLYDPDDIEQQFRMSARSRLSHNDVKAILKVLRRLDRKKRLGGEVVATAGEVLAEDLDHEIVRDSATDDTRVKTAVSWLEEAALLTREDNHVEVFPSSLRVRSVEEARDKLAKAPLTEAWRLVLLRLVVALLEADADEGLSTDELRGRAGVGSDQELRLALSDLERHQVASNDLALTAFVHIGVAKASKDRLQLWGSLEEALIAQLQLDCPELARNQGSALNIRVAAQHLKDKTDNSVLPSDVRNLVQSLASAGRHEASGRGSMVVKRLDAERLMLTLQREWTEVRQLARDRRAAASCALEHLIGKAPDGAKGVDLLVKTTLGELHVAIESDMFLRAAGPDPRKLVDHALLWLHEREVIRLNRGLAVFRSAMTIKLKQDKRGFLKADFKPLSDHYAEQVVQVHVMAEYAQRGLKAVSEAVQLTLDYFNQPQEAFIKRWLSGRDDEIHRETTPRSWHAIVESLNDRAQEEIVTDARDKGNVLVLAGPGSGKTRVLVHRIAYLIRVKRESPRGIIALAYNHHAAVQIRRRLVDLIGIDARGVVVLTCHALAMRIAGVSFADMTKHVDDDPFKVVLRTATAILKGQQVLLGEPDEQRERILAGFRWILVDEYQDIGQEAYELISALAGRTEEEEEQLSLFAVGDDDQNIYTFNGTSVDFIRRFEADYNARPEYLTDNYRSTAHIIAAANAVIAPAHDRMKEARPIAIDKARRGEPLGGTWETIDPVGLGRVQIIDAGADAGTQAMAVIAELQRMAALAGSSWDWSSVAVLARQWLTLDPVRACCELSGIPVQLADEKPPPVWRLRESQALLDWVGSRKTNLIDPAEMLQWLDGPRVGPWWHLLREAVEAYALETSGQQLPAAQFRDWLAPKQARFHIRSDPDEADSRTHGSPFRPRVRSANGVRVGWTAASIPFHQ